MLCHQPCQPCQPCQRLPLPLCLSEIRSLEESQPLYEHLKNLEFMLAEVHRDLASDAQDVPDNSDLKDELKAAARDINRCFNKHFGSIFRSGWLFRCNFCLCCG